MSGILGKFFGSTWKTALIRIALGLVLFLGVTWFHAATWNIMDYWVTGWPMAFEESWGPCMEGETCYTFNIFALICDILIWYAVSCLLILGIEKIRKKDQ